MTAPNAQRAPLGGNCLRCEAPGDRLPKLGIGVVCPRGSLQVVDMIRTRRRATVEGGR
jgi:hypothetical protein